MDKKKSIILLVVVIIICSGISLYFNHQRIKKNQEIAAQEETERIKKEAVYLEDSVPPVLILSQDKIVAYKGDELNYLSFVESVTDNLEGDLIKKVKYNEIDVNKVGEYDVTYEVQDKASNITEATLHVIIREKPNFKY